MLFRGEYGYKVDGLGRVYLPADCRFFLKMHYKTEAIVIARDHRARRCLNIFPVQEWEEFLQYLNSGVINQRLLNAIKRASVITSYKVNLDKKGRFQISDNHRGFIGLKKHVVFSAGSRCLQLWPSSDKGEVNRDAG